MSSGLSEYRYRGARALVLLHEEHLRRFLAVWKRAQAAKVALPETQDPSYASLDALLLHVLAAARGYMVWTCKQLGLPDPEIRPRPEVHEVAAQADDFLEHILDRWRGALRDATEEQFEKGEYESRWGARYTIDAMMEHAVMHPIRHTFQLEELMGTR